MKVASLREARAGLLARAESGQPGVAERVNGILEQVKARGDAALLELTKKFDGVELAGLEVGEAEKLQALAQVDRQLLAALKRMKKNLEATAKEQVPKSWRKRLAWGEVGQVFTPIEKIGVYAPGGRAVYPSSVLMAAVPAKAAGVKEIFLCTPPGKDGRANQVILAAASICGIKRVFKVGGAQAIAAMAFGTRTIPKAMKIVGPGNVWVATAKLLVRSAGVEIDMPAGPSEVLIIADDSADANAVAFGLIAQAEHDPDAVALAVATSREKAVEIGAKVEKEAARAARKEIVQNSLERNGAILYGSLGEAIAFANDYAPEHLQVIARNAEAIAGKVKNAGSIFLGRASPVPFGDYNAGSNHVLPTGGAAKIFSGLSAASFMKSSYVTRISGKGARLLAKDAALIARAEGLDAHAKAVEYSSSKEGK